MPSTHAVGIDLGTTYSCLAYLNEHGEPVSIPNQEGEISTPSIVLIENGEEVVGTEALRNAILNPGHVIQNAKRYLGDPNRHWTIEGRTYTPVDVSAAILRKLVRDAQIQIGPIDRAVITVPAQFSDLQRQATVEAGRRAGLKQIDIINEPVAAALCYVLGSEGLWFSELAAEQRILVYDLGGGTFDLSLVSYEQNHVRVVASTGDLQLGGIDWNQALLSAIADQFRREFNADPRQDLQSLQQLTLEVEHCKRSLTVRPRAALICQHAGQRKSYQVEQAQFSRLTQHLLRRTEEITTRLLKDNNMGWAHVDVILSTGGSSRMPMVREMLKRLGGRTLNTSLSPDQSIAHGATYYAGMLISNNEFVHSILTPEASARLASVHQQSVTARALGLLIRDVKSNVRVPYYLIPANSPLPAEATHTFGTVNPNQRRIHLRIVESGSQAHEPPLELGTCRIEDLPPNLPVDSEIAVTISYDSSARVHVSARHVVSGKSATVVIDRTENVIQQAFQPDEEIVLMPADPEPEAGSAAPGPRETSSSTPLPAATPQKPAAVPEPLLNSAPAAPARQPRPSKPTVPAPAPQSAAPARPSPGSRPAAEAPAAGAPPASARPKKIGPRPVPPARPKIPAPDPTEILELPQTRPANPPTAKPSRPRPGRNKPPEDPGAAEFWSIVDED
jgi:molecular chaperone DnaK